jgi:hypothetical protein
MSGYSAGRQAGSQAGRHASRQTGQVLYLGCAPSMLHRLSLIASLWGDILGRCSRQADTRAQHSR